MSNELQLIVQESGLPQTKAEYILQQFQHYFTMAAEWEIKAKSIIVTDESQKTEMEMARVGRLFLKEQRLKVEKARVEMKKDIIMEGKAIEGIANVLKALIVPIEEHLDKQEHFVENKKKEEEARIRIEVEKKMEEERIAKEKAEAEERERIRLENEKLKAEAIERERQAQEERMKLEAEKKAVEEKARKQKEAAEKKLKAEREEHEKQIEIQRQEASRIQREKEDAERKNKEKMDALITEKKAAEFLKAEESKKQERLLKQAVEETARVKAELAKQKQVECPYCRKTFFV
jgi:hypothetical protein